MKKGDRFTIVPKQEDNSDIFKVVLKEWIDSNEKTIEKFPYNELLSFNSNLKTKWYKINSLQELLTNEEPYKYLINELSNQDFQLPKRCNIRTENYVITSMVGLVFPEEEVAGKIGWGWVFLIDGYIPQKNGEKSKQKIQKSFVLPIMSLDQADLSKRIPQSKSLQDKIISVIGLGSLGAPSVLEFAKKRGSQIKTDGL